MREDFEEWAVKQFGDYMKVSLAQFDEEDGYQDKLLNAMWIGFNAGAILWGGE